MNILNSQVWVSRYLADKDIPTEQIVLMRRIISRYYNQTQKVFNYAEFEDSKHWQEMLLLTSALQNFDVRQLKTDEMQLSFWLNTFNLLVLHATTKMDRHKNTKHDSDFFSETAYQIGTEVFSLDDIEHGILRANSAKYGSTGAYFKNRESLADLIVNDLDPRIHFALYSACNSSPALAAYHHETVADQLHEQSCAEIGKNVELHADKLIIPKIFKWYKNDFGDKDDIVNFISAHSSEIVRTGIHAQLSKIAIKYQEFDWSINNRIY